MHAGGRRRCFEAAAPPAMGNSYSGAKPAFPSVNIGKVKQLTPDNPDELYIGTSHPQRNVVSLSSARLPGAARKLAPTAHLISAHHADHHSSSPGMDGAAAPGRLLANNIVAKPQVPPLNLGRQGDTYVLPAPAGAGGQSLSARPAGQHGPGSLPHIPGGGAARGAHTSRPAPAAYAAAPAPAAPPAQQHQQYADGIRAAPAAVETGPITPAQALQRYSEYLTAYEQSEILQYQQIWFLGKADVAKIKGNPHLQKTNFGYDDERGDYLVTARDHIAYRYEVQGVLGKGSFGQVLKVLDYKTGGYKALKIIRNKKRFHHQAQVELKVLEHLRSHDPDDAHHVIHIQEHFTFRNHLCITFELLSINLYEFIKQNNFAGLSLQLIRRFAAQMLVSLRFLRRHRLIHCDLKPENVLLVAPQRSGIKVIDFGSSCFVEERMYTYVQSRFYRSPEVIMGLKYGCEIDMWSFGCILAELFMGYPLFPGEDETEQLLCIMEIMGLPPPHLVDSAERRKNFFDANGNPTIVPNSRGKVRTPGAKSLWGVLRCQDPAFVDLLEKCLRWDPSERMTPEQAMAHPWMLDSLAQAAAVGSAAAVAAAAGLRGRSRQDQAPVAHIGGKLQPSSVIAAAAAALGGGGGPMGKAASKNGPLSARGGPLCSGSDTVPPGALAAHGYALGAPAAPAGAAGWQGAAGSGAQHADGGVGRLGGPATPRAHAGACSDTSQSGIDCTPRQLSQGSAVLPAAAAASGSLSAAAPAVLSGGAVRAGNVNVAAGDSGYTPRAMETDAPVATGKLQHAAIDTAAPAGGTKQQALNALMAAGTQQALVGHHHHQHHHVPHQQRSSGGRDVHGTDQAALIAASNLLKMQASITAAAAANAGSGGGGGGGGCSGPIYSMVSNGALPGVAVTHQQAAAALMQRQQLKELSAALQQQQQQQQQRQHSQNLAGASAWTERLVSEPAGPLGGTGGLTQQQQHQLMLLLQQQEQLAAGMAVDGHGAAGSEGNAGCQPMAGEPLGGVAGITASRLLPRLQR